MKELVKELREPSTALMVAFGIAVGVWAFLGFPGRF